MWNVVWNVNWIYNFTYCEIQYNSVLHLQDSLLLGGGGNIKKQGKTLKIGAEGKNIQQ